MWDDLAYLGLVAGAILAGLGTVGSRYVERGQAPCPDWYGPAHHGGYGGALVRPVTGPF